jgi:hypothetical protein
MNGDPNAPSPSQTPKQITYIVVISEAVLAFIGLGSLCLSLFYKSYADPAILTAIITLTSAVIGSLVGLLVNTRSTPAPATTSSPTSSQTSSETTSHTSSQTPPPSPLEPADSAGKP